VMLKGGDAKARDALIDALGLFGIGYSWGGFESLITPLDASTCRTATAWPAPWLNAEAQHGVRLWIGLEDPADLIADLEAGLAAWSAGSRA